MSLLSKLANWLLEKLRKIMADIGIKVSKTEKDVYSTDMRDFVVHSAHPSLSLKQIYSGSLDVGESATINHGLGYNPVFLLYSSYGDVGGKFHLQGGYDNEFVSARNDTTDTDNIFIVSDSSSAVGGDYYCHIFTEEGI